MVSQHTYVHDGAQEPQSGFLGKERGQEGEGGGGGVFVKVFSQDRVVCFVEQIIEDVGKVEVFKVFFQDKVEVPQRFVEQNSEAWVWRRRTPT